MFGNPHPGLLRAAHAMAPEALVMATGEEEMAVMAVTAMEVVELEVEVVEEEACWTQILHADLRDVVRDNPTRRGSKDNNNDNVGD